MRVVYLVPAEHRSAAEDALKKEELVNRGSIAVRAAGALGFNEDGFFIILDASEHAVKQADTLLKNLAERYDDADKVLHAYDEQEDAAAEGFGAILG